MLRWYPNWMVLMHPSPKLTYKIKPKRVPSKAIKTPSEFCHSKAKFRSDIQFISSAASYSTSNYLIIFTSQRFTKLSLRLYLKDEQALYRNLTRGTFFSLPPSLLWLPLSLLWLPPSLLWLTPSRPVLIISVLPLIAPPSSYFFFYLSFVLQS